ncbi:MAG: N-acetylglucosamine-6-phosphate deacetylase [Merismopedia sp. SIO2A8]|nr:N-acetylglucosamine-6-phosphate deacetylase [Merismopedia sp. SIO2A8]
MKYQKRNGSVQIINARVPGYEGLQRVAIAPDRTLQSIRPMSDIATSDHSVSDHSISEIENPAETIDVEGDWISPGGIDLQINGGLGLAFPDLDPNNPNNPVLLRKISEYLWDQGIDGFLPTIVTSSITQIHQSLETLSNIVAKSKIQNPKSKIPSVAMPDRAINPKSKILGVHLEGPFLNPTKRGAHPEEHLLPLTLEQVKRVLGDYASIVNVITLAPELEEGTGEVIAYLRSLGITVSLGHSLATAAQAQQAFDQGATMVTHAFNAMPGLHHREPGLLGAALTHPVVAAGFIADGEHVCPTMLDLVLRVNSNLFLVSDALAPLGLPDGIYPWDTREIQVTAGTARLLDGTLSGTTLPLLDGVKNLVKWGLCDVEQAIALATIAPRRAIGMPVWGTGEPVHLLRWTHDQDSQSLRWQRL